MRTESVAKRWSNDRAGFVARAIATLAVVASLAAACRTGGEDPGPRTVQPGPPGEASRTLSDEERRDRGALPHTDADVRFIQNMIHHHRQALAMSALVPERTARADIRLLALRIDRSQGDEIALMERWLRDRGEQVPAAGHHDGHGRHPHDGYDPDHDARQRDGHHADHDARHRDGHHADHDARHRADCSHEHHETHDHDHPDGVRGNRDLMAGMLSPEQMEELAAAEGVEFDRLLLEYMIYHHEGAIEMVEGLFAVPGAAQDSEIYRFASHVSADQRMEIARMDRLLQEVEGSARR